MEDSSAPERIDEDMFNNTMRFLAVDFPNAYLTVWLIYVAFSAYSAQPVHVEGLLLPFMFSSGARCVRLVLYILPWVDKYSQSLCVLHDQGVRFCKYCCLDGSDAWFYIERSSIQSDFQDFPEAKKDETGIW